MQRVRAMRVDTGIHINILRLRPCRQPPLVLLVRWFAGLLAHVFSIGCPWLPLGASGCPWLSLGAPGLCPC